ncbi:MULTISPECIES: hypothetical protein [Agrococcus]|uniref:NADH:ubiquinone oxidoreductase n=1 Tax=Agrococcus pavilionensis RW1 TaxID=1330458 RepID=U1MWK9_9MICO|nr:MULTISPECIES: hypothetical protein [Agrococcus]ERG65000.1 hypothetical protein L332_11170 [Agrococcus pavilionensis RW1]MBO1770777.1 hypothetical protein [Agrococcus sp. TF02-05]
MRKYLFNAGVLSSVASGIGVAKATQKGPRDWRLALLWVSWGIGVALAIGAVNQRDEGTRQQELERELEKAAKKRR